VLGICSQLCKKLDNNWTGQELFDVFITKKHCPDCGGTSMLGPTRWSGDFLYVSIGCLTCFSRFELNVDHDVDPPKSAVRWSSKGTLDTYLAVAEYKKMTFEKFIDEVFMPRLLIGESYGDYK
jgi:hypothetical protein